MVTRTGGRASRHRFDEHTGEVRLWLEAPTLPALLAEAARALAALMAEPGGERAPSHPERVRVCGRDRAALLVAWLNELVFLSETRQRIYSDAEIESVSDREIRATVRGFEPAALRTAVKAATLHDARVDAGPDGFTACVVLDV